MKKGLLLASVAVAFAMPVLADVASANVFGLLTVDSRATDTIVAIPWCECSTNDNEAVSISNIVKTANLTKGDRLTALDANGEDLNTWTLTNGVGGVLYWSSDKMVVTSGSFENSITADQAKAARGTAILLHRQDPSKKFYLYGQVGTLSSITNSMVNGSSETPAYTLIAPPTAADVNLLASGVLQNVGNGDSIAIRSLAGVSRVFTYDGSDWNYYETPLAKTATSTNAIVIAAGTGAWYVSRNSSNAKVIWPNVPVK